MEYFIWLNQLPAIKAIKNAYLSSLQTENLTVAYTYMKAGVEIPLHNHVEEAVDILLEGILEMKIGDETNNVTHGMITVVPSNVPHQAKAITDCKVVTVFYPKRKI